MIARRVTERRSAGPRCKLYAKASTRRGEWQPASAKSATVAPVWSGHRDRDATARKFEPVVVHGFVDGREILPCPGRDVFDRSRGSRLKDIVPDHRAQFFHVHFY